MSVNDDFDAMMNDMIKMYIEGSSMLEIAETYKMTRQAVWKRLYKRGIKIRNRRETTLNSMKKRRWHRIGGLGGVG